MNRLNRDKQTQIIAAMVEGVGINSITRMTGISKNTVLKLLADLGIACANYQDAVMQNLTCKRLECDEIWSFCHSKAKNVRTEHQGLLGYGDLWTWIAMDSDSKLVPCFHVGRRDAHAAFEFISDLASRLKCRVQLTTDGYKPYLEAVEAAFGSEIDYAMLVKLYGKPQNEIRYSPSEIVATEKRWIAGNPQKELVSTSYIERQNLTVRMNSRRFTRLTNGHSKKLQNHIHALSIHYMVYNFARYHQTLRCSPAMAAGVSKTLWSIREVVNLLDTNYAKTVDGLI